MRTSRGETPLLSKVSSPPPRPPLTSASFRTPSSPPSCNIKGRSTSMRQHSSKRDPRPSSPVQPMAGSSPLRRSSSRCSLISPSEVRINELNHKWPSGPDMRSNQSDVVTLRFPPPPPLTSFTLQQQQAPHASSLSGSCSNIRMGTRAIRMSRERDLSGTFEVRFEAMSSTGDQIKTNLSYISYYTGVFRRKMYS